jgi:hypothetical protein
MRRWRSSKCCSEAYFSRRLGRLRLLRRDFQNMGPEKKSPGQTGGTWPGLRRFKAATHCRLQVTGGLAPAVGLHCAPSATFVEQSFLDQPRVQKNPLCEQRNFGSSAPALSANAQTYFSDRLLAGCRLCRSGPRPPFLHPGAALT